MVVIALIGKRKCVILVLALHCNWTVMAAVVADVTFGTSHCISGGGCSIV